MIGNRGFRRREGAVIFIRLEMLTFYSDTITNCCGGEALRN